MINISYYQWPSARLSVSCFLHGKDAEIHQVIKAGITPVYHDFPVQSGLMGAAVVFGAMALFVIVAMYAALLSGDR